MNWNPIRSVPAMPGFVRETGVVQESGTEMDKEKTSGAIHARAVDLACEDDRLWFTRNTRRDFRLREIVPGEFDGLSVPPHGMTWMVLVVKISRQIRVRTTVAHPTGFAADDADDEYLAGIFAQSAPEKLQKIARGVRQRTRSRKMPGI